MHDELGHHTHRCNCEADVDELRRELDAVRADLARLRGPEATPGSSTTMVADRERPTSLDRRRLLRTVGAAAAGGAVAAVASSMTNVSPAAANSGDNFILGHNNVATTPTVLNGGCFSDKSAYFFVHDAGDPIGTPLVDTSAIAATAVGANHGVLAVTMNTKGAGVYGMGQFGSAVGVRAVGPAANLQLDGYGGPPPGRSDPHVVGQIIEDGNADLWLCVGAGTPGTFRKLAGPATAGAFHPLIAPVRVYDSRAGYPPAAVVKGQLSNGAFRVVDAKANGSGLPAGATAALVNLTVTKTSTAGFVALYRNGIAWPGTSTINWDHADQTTANMAVVALDASALFRAYASLGSACDFLVDVIGYWR